MSQAYGRESFSDYIMVLIGNSGIFFSAGWFFTNGLVGWGVAALYFAIFNASILGIVFHVALPIYSLICDYYPVVGAMLVFWAFFLFRLVGKDIGAPPSDHEIEMLQKRREANPLNYIVPILAFALGTQL